MLSWATESLIEDGRSMSDIKQGVTLEVMGEGTSMGPLSDEMKQARDSILSTADIELRHRMDDAGRISGISSRERASRPMSRLSWARQRCASTPPVYGDRAVTDSEMAQMKRLLHQAMREGAMGMSAALIYPPATYQTTEELVELCRVVAAYDGMYITHLRSERARFMRALDELIHIMRETGVTGEIYHLKASGELNWHKMDEAINKVKAARAEGLALTADMYTYPYSGTGLASCIPSWAHDGGFAAMIERLKEPGDTRADQSRNEPARRRLGEYVLRQRTRSYYVGRLRQEGVAGVSRYDPTRGHAGARYFGDGHGDRLADRR